MINKVKIEEFLTLAKDNIVLDVRSPGEYAHAHIPGAHSLPLFTDEERKIVGTAYKQQSREDAIKIGLDCFGTKMRQMVETVEALTNRVTPSSGPATVLVHCWRGGMRSAGVAWLLDLYGFRVCTLIGGYKAFRNWTLQQFEKQYPFIILGGYTGSGKTQLLNELAQQGHGTIDLEHIANHKGSAFGDLGEPQQPGQEMFENKLALELHAMRSFDTIWLEDESRRIGNINLPAALWYTMRKAPLHFLDVPFTERLDYIDADYGRFSAEQLINAITRIQKRLGSLNAKNAVNHIMEGNTKEAFSILLAYYDKYYAKNLQERSDPYKTISCSSTNTLDNCDRLLAAAQIAN